MTRADLTHIHVLLDRYVLLDHSGSMQSVNTDIERGLAD
jgi:hypothetical protein